MTTFEVDSHTIVSYDFNVYPNIKIAILYYLII